LFIDEIIDFELMLDGRIRTANLLLSELHWKIFFYYDCGLTMERNHGMVKYLWYRTMWYDLV